MGEKKKKLRCKYCGEVLNLPYNEHLDGFVVHPKCYREYHEWLGS